MSLAIVLGWPIRPFMIRLCFRITRDRNSQRILATTILWPCTNCTVSEAESIFFINFYGNLHFVVRNGVFSDDDEATSGEEENEKEAETESTRQRVSTTTEATKATHVDLVTDATVTESSKRSEVTTVRRNEVFTETLPRSSNSDCDEQNKVNLLIFFVQNSERFNQILIPVSIQFFHWMQINQEFFDTSGFLRRSTFRCNRFTAR